MSRRLIDGGTMNKKALILAVSGLFVGTQADQFCSQKAYGVGSTASGLSIPSF